MEGKKTKRRKTTSNKNCHGRQEPKEKSKSSEVMDDKELHDRFEAANVLSSLMFLPPKYSNDDTLIKKSEISTENATKQLTYLSTSIGIPVSLTNHIRTEGKQHLIKGIGNFGVSHVKSNEKSSAILAHLQNKIASAALKGNMTPQTQAVIANHVLKNITVMESGSCSNTVSTVIASGSCTNTVSTVIKAKPVILPLTLVTSSISHNVATALQHIVSSTSNMKTNSAFEIAVTGAASSSYVIPTVATHFTSSIPILRPEMLPSRQKKETADNNLPLKKRRVLPVYEYSGDVSSAITIPSILYNKSLESIECSNNIYNYEPISPESSAQSMQKVTTTLMPGITETTLHQDDSYQPAQFDPCTSFMVLTDVKLALTPDDDGDLPIHIAVVHENTELVKKFIDIMTISGKTVDRFNKLQQTPLHLAVLVNKPDIVVALLSAGANPNLVDRHGYTSIHTAICKQFPECRNAVIKYTRFMCKLNTRDYDGYPSLHKCVELNDIDSMKFLIQNGADINIQDGKAGRSVFLYATEYKRLNMVEFLLENRVDVELQSYAGVSALQTAQADDLDDILQLLYKALNIGKPYEEPVLQSSKKLLIPRIPNKCQLISNGLCSRSDSLSQHGKFNISDISQTSSTSSYTSPIDLSVHRNTESPSPSMELNSRVKKENKTGKGRGKHSKVKTSTPSIIKEKHASVIAVLENRNVHPNGNVYKIKHVNKTQSDSSSNDRSLLTEELRKKLKIGNKGKERNNLEVEPDSDVSWKIKQNDRNVQEQVVTTDHMKVQILGSIISASLLAENDNNNSNPIYVSCVNENYSDISEDEDEESVEKMIKDDADMDSVDSPLSPRTTPFTDKPFTTKIESNETDYVLENQSLSSELKETISETATPKIVDLEFAPLKSNVNDGNKSIHDNNIIDRFKEFCKEKKGLVKHPVTRLYERSSVYSSSAAFLNSRGIEYTYEKTEPEQEYVPSCAQSDESMEVDMSDIAKLNEEANKSESDRAKVTNRLSKQVVLRGSNDEDDNQGLVIDESDTEEDNESANLYPSDLNENMEDKNEFNTIKLQLSEKGDDDEKKNCKRLTHYNEGSAFSVAHSKTVTNGISTTVSSINTEMSFSENKSELESNRNVKIVNERENSSQFCKNDGVCIQNSIAKLPQQNLLNHSDINDSIRNRYRKENIVSNDVGPSVVQLNKLVQKPEMNPSYRDKSPNASSIQEHLKTTIKSHTLYFQDGNDYKPLQIFIDDSVQSSLVLQKMLLASRFSNTQKQSNEPASIETAIKQNVTSAGTRLDTSVSDSKPRNQGCGLITSLMNIQDNQKPINSAFTINTTHCNSVSHSAFVTQNAFIDTDWKPSQLLMNPKNESPLLTSVSSISNFHVQHIKPYLNADKMKNTENSVEFDTPSIIGNHGDVKLCPPKSDFLSRTSTNLVNHTNKRMPSSIVKSTLVTLNGKSTCPGEGTLTRVNPDVRRKLSKALLSSQMKVTLSKTLSGHEADSVYPDIPSFSSSFVETNACVITPVSETRQPF